MKANHFRMGVTALALAGAIAAVAVPASATIRPSGNPNEGTEGCAYEITTSNINIYRYPGGPTTGAVLQPGYLIFSAPRSVFVSGGTTWVFGMAESTSGVYGPVGFVNKKYTKNTICRTGGNTDSVMHGPGLHGGPAQPFGR
jgi:hypothetical protein